MNAETFTCITCGEPTTDYTWILGCGPSCKKHVRTMKTVTEQPSATCSICGGAIHHGETCSICGEY